jgi:chromosomal replication initiator protein
MSDDDTGRSTIMMLREEWDRVRARLRTYTGDAAFNSWLKPLALHEQDVVADSIVLSTTTSFMRDWVTTHYLNKIRELWRMERPAVRDVRVIVRPPERPAAGTTHAPLSHTSAPEAPAREAAPPPVETVPAAPTKPQVVEEFDRALSAPFDPRFTFENFIVGRPNELAYAAARRVAESERVEFNPLYIYGGVGLGKTHLLHAIALHIRARDPKRRVAYLSAERFMHEFIRALRFKDTMTFKEQLRSVDVLMVDDVQFIAGKESTQDEFFHTFNALIDHNKQIVLSGDRSPADLEKMEERLKSRLGWGLVADIHPTDYELRLGILQAKAERAGANVPLKVMEFLAYRISSNVRELEGALNRLLAYQSLVGRPITLESAQDVLQDLLRANDRRITIEEIQKKVAAHYSIKLNDMVSHRRAREVARPRQVAMYLAKQLTSRSLPEIGKRFGDRDHTTVLHAVRRIEELRATDATFAEDLDLLRRMLEA